VKEWNKIVQEREIRGKTKQIKRDIALQVQILTDFGMPLLSFHKEAPIIPLNKGGK
jgi:hypothetical protein